MTICHACGQEKTTAEGCTIEKLQLRDGTVLPRVPYRRVMPDVVLGERCSACGAVDGSLHHQHCNREMCPSCRGKLVSCGCL